MAVTIGNSIGAIFSFIGLLLGYSAFLTFTLVYHNYHAGVLAFLSGVYASIVFLMNILDIRNRLREWYAREDFKCIRLFAFIGILIGSTTMIWSIFVQIYYNIPILPVNTSRIIPLVWAFMTLKWSVVLFFGTRKYSQRLEEDQALLPGSSSSNY